MSIGGNADEKLRLLVVAGKGDALKGLNNLFISYEKQNTKEAYNSNGNLERV